MGQIEEGQPPGRRFFLALNARGVVTEEDVIALLNLEDEYETVARYPPLVNFRTLALLLPQRLWEEDLGDALEVLGALKRSGAPRWQFRLKVWTTYFWCLANAVRELVSSATGQARGGEK